MWLRGAKRAILKPKYMSNIKFSLRLICVVFILIPNTAFSDGLKVDMHRADQEIVVETGVIFSEKISHLNKLCNSPETCWTPNSTDIATLEKNILRHLLLSREHGANEISKNLATYKRKYFGYIKNGDRWILVVGICSKYWRPNGSIFQTLKRPMTDMGTCFFEVEYNADTSQFEELYIDGEA
jgi:hypothetical protein